MVREDPLGGVWVDDDAGPVVRPYAVTRGRARPSRGELDLLTMVVTVISTRGATGFAGCGPEHEAIVALCRMPMTLADIAARLDLPIGIVRVLLGDLMDRRMVDIAEPVAADGRPSDQIFEAVLDGLRAL